MSPRLRFGGRSDVGLQRHNNQDSMYAGPRLIAVADGVGGAVGGEVASSLAITALESLDTEPIGVPADALRAAANRADAAIREATQADPGLSGMSTTLTAIVADDEALTMAHIGDSRAYRLREGELLQLTHDHTVVQSLIDEGQITPEQAATHPRRSWILRALDGRGNVQADVMKLEARDGDRFLVCSDGLSGYVDEAAMAAALADGDPQDASDRLIELALQAGAPDNVTCVVADPVDGDVVTQPPLLAGAVATPPDISRGAAAEQAPPADASDDAAGRPRSIGRRLAIVFGALVLLVAAAVIGTVIYVHHQWYVADSAGNVAVFHGVQGSVAGIALSHLQATTNLPTRVLSQDDRDRLSDGISSTSESGAQSTVAVLRRRACDLAATNRPTPTPSPSPRPTASGTKSGNSGKASTKPRRPTTPAWCAGLR